MMIIKRLRLSSVASAMLLSMGIAATVGEAIASVDVALRVSTPVVSNLGKSAKPGATEDNVTSTGAFSYAYPLDWVKGRHDVTPAVGLNYVSNGALRGGVAAGWSLQIPMIESDTSMGTIRPDKTTATPDRYNSSFAGGGQLVKDSDAPGSGTSAAYEVYVALGDTSGTRYEKIKSPTSTSPHLWVVRTTDGSTHYFGHYTRHRYHRAPLLKSVDPFGHEIRYSYTTRSVPVGNSVPVSTGGTAETAPSAVEYELTQISYHGNADSAAYATVDFERTAGTTCPVTSGDVAMLSTIPVGAHLDYRNGEPHLYGARKLTAIKMKAMRRTDAGSYTMSNIRRYDLEYETTTEACTGLAASPMRQLKSIQLTGYAPDGSTTVAPKTTFSYGSFTPTSTITYSAGTAFDNMPYMRRGEIAHSVKRAWTDYDGDGKQDTLYLSATGTPRVNASLLGDVALSFPQWTPTVTSETSALNYRVARYNSDGAPFVNEIDCAALGPFSYEMRGVFDLNNDRLPDLVTEYRYNPYLVDGDDAFHTATTVNSATKASGVSSLLNISVPRGCEIVLGYGGFYVSSCDEGASGEDQDDAFSQAMILNSFNGPTSDGLRGTIAVLNEPLLSNPAAHCTQGGIGVRYPDWAVRMGSADRQFPTKVSRAEGLFPQLTIARAPDADLIEMVSGEYTYTDLNGDGRTDRIRNSFLMLSPTVGTWNLVGRNGSDNTSFDWSRAEDIDGDTQYSSAEGSSAKNALQDLNGDGLPDWFRSNKYFLNKGDGFTTAQFTIGDSNQYLSTSEQSAYPYAAGAGWRYHTKKLMDIDRDGLVDLVTLDTSVAEPTALKVRFNQGSGSFSAVEHAQTINSPLLAKAFTEAWEVDYFSDSSTWESVKMRSAYIDMNGDGLEDLIVPSGSSQMLHLAQLPTGDAPPRVLQRIDNGVGGKVNIAYAPSSDNAVVTQSIVGRQYKTIRNPTWVVKSISSDPGSALPAQQTQFKYNNPIWNQDLAGVHGFRGFESRETTSATGAKSVSEYAFDQHYAGLLKEKRLYSAESTTRPAHIETYTYQGITAYHDDPGYMAQATYWLPDSQESMICGASQTDSQCRSSGSKRVTVTRWKALKGGTHDTPDVMDVMPITDYVDTYGDDGFGNNTSVRSRTDLHYLLTGHTNWIIKPHKQETLQPNAAHSFDIKARKDMFYSTDLKRLERDREYIDSANYLETRHEFSSATGLLTSITSPKAIADNPSAPSKTRFEYDNYGVTLYKTTNELGHELFTKTDIGTGVTLTTLGPNFVSTATGTVYYTQKNVIDGLGRIREVWQSKDDSSSGYVLEKLASTEYDDSYVSRFDGRSARLITTKTRVNGGGGDRDYPSTWTETKTYLDGASREIRVESKGDNGNWLTSDYDWNAAGQMTTARVPNPNGSAGQVPWEFVFDSLDRITHAYAPAVSGATTSGNRRLVTTTAYDGVQTTITEYDDGENNGAQKQVINNSFGQLAKVKEKLNNGNYVTTEYRYDALGNVTDIRDPDGVQTQLTHDMAGRRIGIDSSGKRWTYGYDNNGNLISVLSPRPSGAAESDYKITMSYDLLNRLKNRTVPKTSFSATDVTRLGIGSTNFYYDTSHSIAGSSKNNIGRLTWSESPSSISVKHYDASGDVTKSLQSIKNIAGVGQVSKEPLAILNSYYDEGRLKETYLNLLNENALTTTGTTESLLSRAMLYHYSAAGEPARVRHLSGASYVDLALLTRNNAQQVTQRRSELSGHKVKMDWSYNQLGQIDNLQVQKQASGEAAYSPVFSQTYEYWYNGLPLAVNELISGKTRRMEYEYDTRHQITLAEQVACASCTDNAPGYRGEFSYTAGGRLNSANVALSALGTTADKSRVRVSERNVSYRYDSSNPQQLDRLDKVAGGVYADYAYDAAGNNITRVIDGKTQQLTYDGENRLRRIKSLDGTKTEEFYYDGATRILAVQRDKLDAITNIRRWFGNHEVHYTTSARSKTWSYVGLSALNVARLENDSKWELNFSTPQGHEAVSLTTAGATLSGKYYGPFGEVLDNQMASGQTADKHTREFNGKDFDAVGGLHYYGHRYYDPLAMQWTSADPLYRFSPDRDLLSPRNSNLYTYTMNNPISFSDPDGLEIKKSVRLTNGSLFREGGFKAGAYDVSLSKKGLKASFAAIRLELQAKAGGEQTNISGKVVSESFGGNAVVGIKDGKATVGGELFIVKKAASAKTCVQGVCTEIKASAMLGAGLGASAGANGGALALGPVKGEVVVSCAPGGCFTSDYERKLKAESKRLLEAFDEKMNQKPYGPAVRPIRIANEDPITDLCDIAMSCDDSEHDISYPEAPEASYPEAPEAHSDTSGTEIYPGSPYINREWQGR